MGQAAGVHHAQRRDVTLLRRLIEEVRPYRLRISAVFLLRAMGAPLALLIPVPSKIVLDSVLNNHPLPAFLIPVLPTALTDSKDAVLLFAASLLLGVVVLNRALDWSGSVLAVATGERLILRFRSKLFRHAQRLSLTVHDRRGVTSSLYRIEHDARAVEAIALDGLIPVLTASLTLLAMFFVTVRIDVWLAILALSVAPALMAVTRHYKSRLRGQWSEMKEIESGVLGIVQEVLSTLRVVKAFGQEAREADRFDRRAGAGLQARVRVTAMQGAMGLLLGGIVAGGSATVLYVGARHVQAGVLSLGDLILVMFYLVMLYGPLEVIAAKIGSLQGALASAERAFALLDIAPDVDERPRAIGIARARGAVVFDNVSFGYADGTSVLRSVSFEVAPGSLVGLAGSIGSGKTTLVNLLPRFYDPTGGRILLDGVDVRDYRLQDLRAQFAIVPQDTVLFATTIAENIAYGRPDADHESVIHAARNANAEDFIRRLPDGFDTLVGERGTLLSSGQRQLISLARAFLRDAPLLILDEPTSSIDQETEKTVMGALKRLIVGRTVFMVAHRLYTLQESNHVFLLRDGRLTEPPAMLRASGAHL